MSIPNPRDRFFPNPGQVTLNMIAATPNTAIPNYSDADNTFDPDQGIVHSEPSVRIRALLHPLATTGTVTQGLQDENKIVRAWAVRVKEARFNRPILGPDGV